MALSNCRYVDDSSVFVFQIPQAIDVTIDILGFALDELVINATVKTESLDKSSGKNIVIHKIPVYYDSVLDVLGQAKQDYLILDTSKQIEHSIVVRTRRMLSIDCSHSHTAFHCRFKTMVPVRLGISPS